MSMKNPPHPGLFVLQECIEPLGMIITDAATALGVTRNTLSELVNVNEAYHRKWPCGWPRRSEGPRTGGSCNQRTMSWRRFDVTRSKSDAFTSREGRTLAASEHRNFLCSLITSPSVQPHPTTPDPCARRSGLRSFIAFPSFHVIGRHRWI